MQNTAKRGLNIVTTYEATVSMIQNLPEADLLVINEFVKRLSSKEEIRKERYNPFKHLTREEVVEQLAIARKNAEDGHVMEARQASDNIRAKYGL